MDQRFIDLIEANPVIASIKDVQGLVDCCKNEDIKVVFVLFGDVCSIAEIVEQLKKANKIAVVHIDLITGLSGKEVAVDFIQKQTKADGIISTKPMMIKRARELSLNTILRVFVLDSMALENMEKQLSTARPDAIEILPGLMPKVIKKVAKSVRIPVIAGGMISDKEDVMAALGAGAVSVSSTNRKVWMM